jgi:hypothetical protein
MRARWSDERLDDLSHRVEEDSRRLDADTRELRAEMNKRFDSLQRTLLLIGVMVIVALLGLIGAQLSLGVTIVPLLWSLRRTRINGARR